MNASVVIRRSLKKMERLARAVGVRVMTGLFGVPVRGLSLARGRPLRVLVIRLDPRLGNVLLSTPLLNSLRARYADAAIDVLVHPYAARVLRGHPSNVRVLPIATRSLVGPHGLIRRLRALRRQGYDVCIDATNPTAPSITQALLSRFCGATATVGYDVAPFASLYSARVPVADRKEDPWHELDARLSLLGPLGPGPIVRETSVGPLEERARPEMVAFVEAMHGRPLCVINLGARAAARRVSAADGATVANLCKSVGLCPVLVAGRDEHALLDEVQRLSLDGVQAPDADLNDLSLLFKHAFAFVSGDTGPMHLGVALGCPTLGIFSVTDPNRYGYSNFPHGVIDARGLDSEHWAPLVRAYFHKRLADTRKARAEQQESRRAALAARLPQSPIEIPTLHGAP